MYRFLFRSGASRKWPIATLMMRDLQQSERRAARALVTFHIEKKIVRRDSLASFTARLHVIMTGENARGRAIDYVSLAGCMLIGRVPSAIFLSFFAEIRKFLRFVVA